MRVSENIFYNIEESNLYVRLFNLKFYFSSEFNVMRFKKGVKTYIDTENMKVSCKYGIKVELDRLLAICYYKKIEKRGFRIENYLTSKRIISNKLSFSDTMNA